MNPLQEFFNRMRAGCYTKTFQKEKKITERLSQTYLTNYHENTARLLDIRLQRLKAPELNDEISYLVKRHAMIDLESVSEDSDLSIESIGDIKVENSLDEISECETVIEMAPEEIKIDMADLDEELFENRKLEAQRAFSIENLRTRKPEPEPIMPSSISLPKVSKVTKNVLTIKVRKGILMITNSKILKNG